MTVHRFFVDPSAMAGERFPLPASIAHQVRAVLRLRDGDHIVLLPGDGSEARVRLEADECVVVGRGASPGEAAHRLTVVQALLKGDALETVIQQGTEVGVAAFRLVVTERCVVRELPPRRVERLRTVARESAEQSGRGRVPEIADPVPLPDVLEPGAAFLTPLHDGPRLRDLAPPPSAVVIGPEGGFSSAEQTLAVAAGCLVAGLGPRVLRSRTTAAAVAAVILSRTDDFA